MARDVEDCPHLRRAPEAEAESEGAVCGLLHHLTGLDDERLCRVPRAACLACSAGSPPSETHLNPAVASLLFDLTSRLVGDGGASAPGCDHERALRLRGWAEEHLFLGADPEPEPSRAGAGPTRRPAEARGRSARRPRIGLVGSNIATGLGSLNRDIVRHLPIDRWLVVANPFHRDLPECPTWRSQARRGTDPDSVRAFLEGLDWLLFCERPEHENIVDLAREMGVRVACVPMWEHLEELSRWVRQVDLMICPTRFCHERLEGWRERLGLRCELALIPWPIDLDRFPFRPRRACRRFLFIHGRGGMPTLDQETPAWDGRKGLWIIREAAKRIPEVSILVRTQADWIPPMPDNVDVRHADLGDSSALYEDGDVCIQPSRWEGLGLPLLECQASGLPLITTDGPPMNEHRPWRAIPASTTTARLTRHHAILVHEVDPDDLARALLEVHGSEISEASLAARRYVEREHSWTVARPRLLETLSHV